MKLHEYQAKELFIRAGIPVPKGIVATDAAAAEAAAREIGGTVVVKAQVHVGGRGKAGGVKLAKTPAEAREKAEAILALEIKGLPVRKVLVTQAADIASECYAGIILDRATQRAVFMVSAAGGVDIEEVAAKTPEKIIKLGVDPALGFRAYDARYLASKLYSDPNAAKQAAAILTKLYRVFCDTDASLVEINPLITNPAGEVWAVDAKLVVDDNALFRHADIEAMRDPDSEELSEVEAREKGLSFVKLDGEIGCVVNGAGLAMTTMDTIQHFGGRPANFLDIGGSSNPEKVVTALKILTRDKNVRSILFNIFGGITRCDDVARGLVKALDETKLDLPIVIRLTGTNEDEARKILAGIGLEALTTMDDAVKKAVALAGRGARS
ncbi:MAG: ADP-forming succinate--CoA ligase subunit beta [bacterium]